MNRRTKIVCTLGPAVNSRAKIKSLISAGMNVARLNCSHGDWETRANWIRWIREVSPDVGPVGILVDLQGPKFRIGKVAGGAIQVKAGSCLTVGDSSNVDIPIRQPEILATLEPGSRLLLGDGNVELKITEAAPKAFVAKSLTAGTVKSNQGVTVVGKVFNSPCLTSQDRADLIEAIQLGVDFVALSYVHAASDIEKLRAEVAALDPQLQICAKVETRQAVKNVDEIIAASDVVMVARGDLGLQMEFEEVPIAQKQIIERCAKAGKPVIVATQMLESMMQSPRPTRAEATDVANAILDGADAIMLSGETASGDYPIQCVRTMVKLADKAERLAARRDERETSSEAGKFSPTEAIAYAVTQLAKHVRPTAILTTTTSGQTARLVSKFRPRFPIYCATWNERTRCQMSMIWGVEAIRVGVPFTTEENIQNSLDGFAVRNRLKAGDIVIITAGTPAGVPGNTNLISMQVVK